MMQLTSELTIHHIHQGGEKDHRQSKPYKPVFEQITKTSAFKYHQSKKTGDHEKHGHPPVMCPLRQNLQPQFHLRYHRRRYAKVPEPIRHLGNIVDNGRVKNDTQQHRHRTQ